jgi:hypothetical protein
MQKKLQRRVYRAELREALGYGHTWFREQQKRGRIRQGHRDPGGKREWSLKTRRARFCRLCEVTPQINLTHDCRRQ